MLTVIASISAAFIASLITTYIALATPFGPWMEPILLLMGIAWLSLYDLKSTVEHREFLVSAVVAGGLAGIIATACSFSYPTLFFLEPTIFNEWLNAPFSFILFLVLSILIAGSVAFALVELWEHYFLQRESLSFPVAQLIYKSMSALERSSGRIFLQSSFVALLYYALTSAAKSMLGSWFVGAQFLPMLFSLGAMTTFSLTLPLLVGFGAKSILVDPIHIYFFPYLSAQAFFFSWCGGLILQSTIHSLFCGIMRGRTFLKERKHSFTFWQSYHQVPCCVGSMLLIGSFLSMSLLLWFLNFSWLAIGMILFGITLCSYQLAYIGGKIGLAPLGRFALFLALPGLLIFKHTSLQVTLVALFVELCGGMVVDLLFGRKLGQLVAISRTHVIKAQLIGLLVGALTTGVILWALCSWGSLGSEPLYAQRAYTRALLIKISSFDMIGIVLGSLFGMACQALRTNTVMVMTGLLMPASMVLPLVLGNLVASWSSHKDSVYAIWAGLFAIGSLVLSLKVLF